ncbi:MAG: DUF418 domain-containing protein [Phenylobacterium sp.]|uniref:DUF418 domain-containing protein n=1 Tax=Phenylobacterium sp. TaxID=1871053 RepID=UPI00391A6982
MNAAPVTERIEAIDVLRGVAVLMIFAVNIKAMAVPPSYYFSPEAWGNPLDAAIGRAHRLLIDEKFFTIFTALFGCGLAIFCDRARAAGRSGVLIYRRLAALFAIGLVHGYLIWFGDVLALYAVAGLVAVQFVRASPRTLYLAALGFLALRMAAEFSPAPGLLSAAIFGTQPAPPPDVADALARAAYLGGWGAQLAARADTFSRIMVVHLVVDAPRVVAIMLAGLGLYRQGFLSAQWPVRAYLAAIIAGAAAVVALRCASAAGSAATGETVVWATLRIGAHFVQAFVYAAVVMGAARAGLRLRPLANAGRMALTNYIACSLIGTTVFYGHGLGLYGALSLAQIMGVVALVWLLLVALSTIWLRRFRFGPLEWAWRCLTYRRWEPLRRLEGRAG